MLYFQDLMPGQAGSATTLIPTRRAWAGSSQDQWRASSPDLELSRCVLVCDGDDYRHSVCLLRIKDV